MFDILFWTAIILWVSYWTIRYFRCCWQDRKPGNTLSESRLNDSEYQINAKLWELLKDEDPVWLALMGITEPNYSLRERHRKEKEAVVRTINQSNQPRRERIPEFNRPPLLSVVNNVDRDVEAKLEQKLLMSPGVPISEKDLSMPPGTVLPFH